MTKVLASIGLALGIAAASSGSSFASGPMVDTAIKQAVVQQRIDTEEVALPPQPTGPATPIPFCSPSSPICP